MKDSQLRRYARHIVLPEIGEEGQARLLKAKVLVIGAGGLGSAALSYLAAMGIGTLGVIDDDRVEMSNLQRQILHEQADIGRMKVQSAQDRIEELNPEVTVITYPFRLGDGDWGLGIGDLSSVIASDQRERSNPGWIASSPTAPRNDENKAEDIIRNYDLVIDGSDNYPTRFLLNATCYRLKKPLISAAIRAFTGQLSTFKAYLGPPHPCYQCFIPEIPPVAQNCSETGVLGALAGVMGSLQAMEAVKELLGIGESLSGKLLIVEGLSGKARTIILPREPECPVCGH